MMDLHYTSALILFLSSVIGCLLPFQRLVDVTPIRPLSTGIIFAVALCHLLPDASQILNIQPITVAFMRATGLEGSVGEDGLYDVLPVAETLMCLGIFVMLVIDQCIPCPHHQVPPVFLGGTDASLNKEQEQLVPASANGATCGGNSSTGYGATNHGHDHGHGHAAPQKIANAKVYATEVAIAIHSVIIGFTMGVAPDSDSLIGLTVAMVFHQMFEGIALAMIALQGNLGFQALCAMVVMFAASLPAGILVGMNTYRLATAAAARAGHHDNDSGGLDVGEIIFQGVPNAIAAGMLLHIGFELLMEDFNHTSSKFPARKLMLAFLGGSAVCFLAIWA